VTRRQALLTFVLLFYTALIETSITSLIPTYTAKFALSKVEVGVLVGSQSLAVLALSVPVGLLSDRLGPSLLTTLAAGIEALAAVGQGLAPNFALLCASWALFGVGLAVVVTASLAWLAQTDNPSRRAALLSASTSVSGAGLIAGPLFGGLVVAHLGLAAPFIAAALVGGLLASVLVASGSVFATVPRTREHSLWKSLPLYRGEPRLLAGLTLALLLATMSSTINVLVPLGLHTNGVSTSRIGLLFAAASAIFVAVSAMIARAGRRYARLRVAACAAMLCGAAFSIPLASASTLALACFVCLRAPGWAIASTITYPLSAEGARDARLSHSANFGLLNLAWGVPAVIVPPLVGEISQTIGQRWAYLPAFTLAVTAACWLYTAQRRSAGTSTTGVAHP
jgi:MFS family permease